MKYRSVGDKGGRVRRGRIESPLAHRLRSCRLGSGRAREAPVADVERIPFSRLSSLHLPVQGRKPVRLSPHDVDAVSV